MSEGGDDSLSELLSWRSAAIELGDLMPGSGLEVAAEGLRRSADWPPDLSRAPLVLDSDIGGDPDDAFAVAAAALASPDLRLVVTADETGGDQGAGQRARFARHLLDLTGRPEVPVTAGISRGPTRYYCVEGLAPAAVGAQDSDFVAAVRDVADRYPGPLRWAGLGPMSNLALLLERAPELAGRLHITQMGGAFRYRDPDRAEHNIRLDVAAARAVLSAATVQTVPGLEFVCSDVTFRPETTITTDSRLYEALSQPGAPAWARLLAAHTGRWFAAFHPGSCQADALTLTAALGLPFVDSDRVEVTMDEAGRTTPGAGGAKVWWSTGADYAAFSRWLEDTLRPRPTGAA